MRISGAGHYPALAIDGNCGYGAASLNYGVESMKGGGMRVGLVFAQTRMSDDAFLSDVVIGGESVLRRQITQCIALACEKIICVMDNEHPQFGQMARANYGPDIEISQVPPARLIATVTAQDYVVVMGEGVVADHAYLRALDLNTQEIAVFSADWAVDLGYERIDKDHAFAGLMVISGRLVAKLADLPADFDRVSSLLRLALQERTAFAFWDRALHEQSGWRIVRRAEDAWEWLAHARNMAFPLASSESPLASLRSAVMRRLIGDGSALSTRIAISRALGLCALILAAVFGGMQSPVIGGLILAAAGFLLHARRELTKFKNNINLQSQKMALPESIWKYVIDAVMFFIIGNYILMTSQNNTIFINNSVIVILCYISMYQLAMLEHNHFTEYDMRICAVCGVAGVIALGIFLPALYLFAIGAACLILYKISSRKITRD